MSPKGRNAMTNYKIKKPVLSIYMPVFNAAPYLVQSIESILNQTLKNFEFIIIDDASTDSSWKIIKSFARRDPRIRACRNRQHCHFLRPLQISCPYGRRRYFHIRQT